MGLKFKITDGENEYKVEELEEEVKDNEFIEPIHDEALTSEEITALKQLAAAAPQLLKLLEGQEAEAHDDIPEEADRVEISADEEECEDADEDEDEKVVKTNDSIKSAAGSIIKTKSKDSIDEESRALEIEEAYKNRYK